MEGRARSARRHVEDTVTLSWLVGARVGEAMAGKLKKLDHYLAPIKPRRAQTAAEMLDVFREFQARGVPMNIRKLN